ncbi:unnamed protein product [Pocillopora meandrina]|uniref:Uncharacterized protein n=1 Tax=Pocillopora meandrina TaxID=46732 RepID=A0AAU9XVL4_9CNID|nr:unnamed protein product [Pocillopora meandrina]
MCCWIFYAANGRNKTLLLGRVRDYRKGNRYFYRSRRSLKDSRDAFDELMLAVEVKILP